MRKISLYIVLAFVSFVAKANESYLKVAPNLAPDKAKYAVEALDRSQITSIETTIKGRLWASVLCGGEGANGFLTLAYSDSQGKSWVEPVVALDARNDKLSVRNGVLWRSPKGELWLFYSVFDGFFDGRGSMWAMVCQNPDDAKPVWQSPRYLGVGVATGRPMLNNKGEWVLPAALWGREVLDYGRMLFVANRWDRKRFDSPYLDKYTELDSKRGAGVYISSDEGKSWQENLGVVNCNDELIKARYNNPQIFVQADGTMRMVLRASGTAWSYSSISADGKSWSEPQRFVSAPDQNFAIHRLASGQLLMVRNGRFDRNLYWLPEGMYAYLSEDNGATWYGGLRLASDCATINPAVAEGNGGVIYISTLNAPEDKSVNTLVTTSLTEIDAATADYENNPKSSRVVLTVGGAGSAITEEMKALVAPKTNWASESMRLATFNIQYPIMNWKEDRVAATVAVIRDYDFDIVGSQEPFLPQIEDLMEHLSDTYAWVGQNVSGDNSDRKHHFNPIFYRKSRFEVLDYDTVWLTDKIGTPGYGARSVRLFTWVKFYDKKTDKVFYHFNGHYDHRGHEAKIVASHIVLDMVRHVSKGMPAFVTADYNADEKSEPYAVLKESGIVDDSMDAVANPINKQYQSLTGYKSAEKLPKNGMHIDHLFYTPNAVKINNWELIIKSYDGKWGSDHLPIYVDCVIAN